MPKFMGVDTNDPDIVNVIRNMTDRGAETGEIVKVVGMPYEVCDSHRQQRLRQTQKVTIGAITLEKPEVAAAPDPVPAKDSRETASERMKKYWADKKQGMQGGS